MTKLLFRDDPYLQEATSVVASYTPEGAILADASVFYPAGGGQPGDSGFLIWQGGRLPIASAVKTSEGQVALIPGEPIALPPIGAQIRQLIDWPRRYKHMRVHTALHLLSVVIPLPVTGGQIGPGRGRLDFDMPEPVTDLAAIEDQLNLLVEADAPVSFELISEEELLGNSALVKTLRVRPPSGSGSIRLVRIGTSDRQIDLQACGGTHVARTGEIGRITVERIENKGRMNRRVTISVAD